MSVLSRSVWFPEFRHPIPLGPINKEQFPLQHLCLPVENVGVHQTSMVNQNPLEALNVNVMALEYSKEVFGPSLFSISSKPSVMFLSHAHPTFKYLFDD